MLTTPDSDLSRPGTWLDWTLRGMGLLSLLTAASSLRWRMDFDTPLLLYAARLIELGKVPYRDFFDVNLPGTYLLNLFVLKLFGKSDSAVRIADLTFLTTVCLLTWLTLRRLDRRAAWAGSMIFFLLYLSHGSLFALQRDFLLLLPLTSAIFLFGSEGLPGWARWLGIGLAFGCIASIKPQGLLGLPVFAVVEWKFPLSGDTSLPRRRALHLAAWGVAGFSIPVLGAVFYLARAGALDPLLEIVTGYWPLFADLSGEQQILGSLPSRLVYRISRMLEEGGHLALLLPAVYGACVGWCSRLSPRAATRRVIALYSGLAATSALAVFLVGRFWAYHWLPCWLALAVLVGFAIVPQRHHRWSAMIFAIFVFQLMAPLLPRLYLQPRSGRAFVPKGGRVDEIAAFLRENLEPEDRVQLLDWTGGALNAMLAVDARVATSFIYTYQFHHHVSSPYIRGLRRRFMVEMNDTRPRFVLEVHQIWGWIRGPDSSPRFPELRRLLKTRYQPRFRGEGYTIHELRSPKPQERTSSTGLRVGPPFLAEQPLISVSPVAGRTLRGRSRMRTPR